MESNTEYHPDAHSDATEITGDRRYGEWGQCIATAKSTGNRCRGHAQGPHGKCGVHGGNTPTADENPDVGAPKNNGNSETHGLTSDAEKWFERHRDEVEDDVRKLTEKWIQDAPFGWDSGNVSMLVRCAINEMQMRHADDYVDENGVIVEQVIGVTEDGRQITAEDENPALLPKSRLQKDTIRALKELGIFEPEQHEVAHSGEVGGEFSINISHHRVTEDESED